MAKLTDEYIKHIVEEKGFKCISIQRIKDSKGRGQIEVTVMCLEGHITTKRWGNIRDGHNCKYCVDNNIPLTIEEIRQYVESFGYKLLSNKYGNAKSILDFQCDKGHKYSTTYSVFKRGFRCPYCSNKAKYTLEDVRKIIENEGYKLLSTEYKNANEYIRVQCNKEHEPYNVTFSDFNNNKRRCPHCKSSKGENKISEVLTNMDIEFKEQYKFDDCKSINKLPFDFYLINYNILIEFDGLGHYQPVNWNGNKEKSLDVFIGTIIRDTIKNDYCRKNNIKLIRIPYWEFDNIEKILKENLK